MKRNLTHKFSEIYRTQDGNKVRVEMQDAPDLNPGATVQPRKVAVIQKGPLVPPGTIIFGGGTAYLLVLEDTIANMNRFRSMEITHYLRWSRLKTIIDPVTRMAREDQLVIIEERLPIVIEPLGLVKEQGIERPKVMFHTGADVQIGDLVGDFKIHSYSMALGVRLMQGF